MHADRPAILAVVLWGLVFVWPTAGFASSSLFTAANIYEFSPRARSDLVEALVSNQDYLRDAGITTPLRLAHFLAQVATETGGMRRIDENMNYSEDALLRVFSRRTVSPEKAKEIARNPQLVANWVYGNRLGNRGRDTNDGWEYRGSGFIQLTGRSNFRDRGSEIGLPLEASPAIARQPVEGLSAATSYWSSRLINEPADRNDIHDVRQRVNGPAVHGLAASKLWFSKAAGVFGQAHSAEAGGVVAESSVTDDGTAAPAGVAEALVELGFIAPAIFESGSITGQTLTEGLRAYQKSRGLEETGELDEETFYAITDRQEWHRETGEAAASSSEGDRDTGVSFALSPVGGSATIEALEPNPGTGIQVRDYQLSPEEMSGLAEATAAYAEYEVVGGRRDEQGDFIPFSIILPDQRVAITDTTAFPARAIVQIKFSSTTGAGRHLCSGSMISADTVLTAGHCVHSGTRSGDWYSDYAVFPGRNKGAKPFGRCGASKLFALKGWVEADNVLDARYYDLGAIKLDCNVGERTGTLGVRPLSDAEDDIPTSVQGYAGDKTPAGTQWLSEDHIRALQSLKGFYQNDTYGGTSGSPVYSGDAFVVIGVHTNGLHNGEPWKSNNGFTRITPDRLREIVNWIED